MLIIYIRFTFHTLPKKINIYLCKSPNKQTLSFLTLVKVRKTLQIGNYGQIKENSAMFRILCIHD